MSLWEDHQKAANSQSDLRSGEQILVMKLQASSGSFSTGRSVQAETVIWWGQSRVGESPLV